MALSLDSIYRPFNEFFSKFGAGAGTPVMFRFAHVPRAFVDSDFLTPLHPEWGPSPAIAQEQLSTVVDGVPRLDADGRTVWLSTARLSELYHDEILGPAIPFVPADVTDRTEKQARIEAFNKAKADAMRLWEQIKAVSLLEGVGVEFRPSTAQPGKWWDKTDAGVWTHQSFQVKGAPVFPDESPPHPLLRRKVDDTTLRSVLQSQVVAPAQVRNAGMLSRPALVMAQPVFTAALVTDAARAASLRATPAIQGEVMLDRPLTAVALQDEVTQKIAAFPFRERLELQELLATHAPRQSVVTNNATISFDYCVVTVTRSWLSKAFINNQSWRIPGQAKGQLSANNGHGLPALPVGFIVVKNLSIQAPWTPEDITNLALSVQFGPFNFDSRVVNGTISHNGLQIIGVLFQPLPTLPPNATPGG